MQDFHNWDKSRLIISPQFYFFRMSMRISGEIWGWGWRIPRPGTGREAEAPWVATPFNFANYLRKPSPAIGRAEASPNPTFVISDFSLGLWNPISGIKISLLNRWEMQFLGNQNVFCWWKESELKVVQLKNCVPSPSEARFKKGLSRKNCIFQHCTRVISAFTIAQGLILPVW